MNASNCCAKCLAQGGTCWANRLFPPLNNDYGNSKMTSKQRVHAIEGNIRECDGESHTDNQQQTLSAKRRHATI